MAGRAVRRPAFVVQTLQVRQVVHVVPRRLFGELDPAGSQRNMICRHVSGQMNGSNLRLIVVCLDSLPSLDDRAIAVSTPTPSRRPLP